MSRCFRLQFQYRFFVLIFALRDVAWTTLLVLLTPTLLEFDFAVTTTEFVIHLRSKVTFAPIGVPLLRSDDLRTFTEVAFFRVRAAAASRSNPNPTDAVALWAIDVWTVVNVVRVHILIIHAYEPMSSISTYVLIRAARRSIGYASLSTTASQYSISSKVNERACMCAAYAMPSMASVSMASRS